jgi:hypothetical protein
MNGLWFVKHIKKFLGKRIDSIPKKKMEALINYFRPGKIREQRNVIEHAMRINRANAISMALAVLGALSMGLSSCAQGSITLDRPQDKVMEAKNDGKDLKILQAWSGDYPLAELGRLPADQVKERMGYIGDKATFAAVWQAMSPSLPLPEVDFTADIVVFCRNTVFYNRTSIARVVLKDGIVEVLAMETMSSQHIEDKVAMAMAVISRSGVKFMQTGSGLIPVGTNAVPMGDRIALHDSTVQNGVIVINYAERGPGEPMTEPPSKGMTKYLRVKDLTLAGVNPLE